MLERLEEWRTRPESVKRRYALTAAVLLTLLIVGVWASTLPTRLAALDFEQSAAVLEAETAAAEREPGIVPPKAPGRFSVFSDRVINGVVVLKNKLVGAQEEPIPELVATTTPMVWTEVVEAQREPIVAPEGKPIMIMVATSTATTTEAPTATTSGDVIQ